MESKQNPIVKQITLDHAAGDQFILRVRKKGDQFTIEVDGDLPAEVAPDLRQRIAGAASTPFAKEEINGQWTSLIESLQAAGWKPHELITATFQFAGSDRRVVSALQAPIDASDEIQDVHRRIHERLANMFPQEVAEVAERVHKLATEGRHPEAFAELTSDKAKLAHLRGPYPDLIDAICLIDRSALQPDDSFHLWQMRVCEKSRARQYADLEVDIQILETEFGNRLDEDDAHNLLLIRAEIAEHSARPEVAYARYRELLSKPRVNTLVRARSNWGAFRLEIPTIRAWQREQNWPRMHSWRLATASKRRNATLVPPRHSNASM